MTALQVLNWLDTATELEEIDKLYLLYRAAANGVIKAILAENVTIVISSNKAGKYSLTVEEEESSNV